MYKNIRVTYETHVAGGATCIKQASCTKCGKVMGEYGSHNLSQKDGHAATCTADGWNSYWQCSTCNKISASNSQAGVTYNSLDEWKASSAGKISKSGHNFSYNEDGNVITAKCQNIGVSCPYNTEGITLTLDANDKDYTGEPYTGAIIGDWSASGTVPGLAAEPTTITYTNQADTATYNDTTAPTNVGNYKASITVESGDNSATATKDFKITKKAVAVGDLAVVTVTDDDAVYNGQPKPAQVSVASGKTDLGAITVKYQKQKNDTDWDEATTEEPVNAGTYRILVSTAEGNNFKATSDLTDDAWKFTIAKKPITIHPTAGQKKYFGENDPVFTYGDFQDELVEETDEITGALGREDGETVTSEGYAFTVGTLSAGDNYELSIADGAPKFTIERLDSINRPDNGVGYELDYVEETLKADPDAEFEIGEITGGLNEISSRHDTKKLNPGDTEQTYYVRYKDNDNHPESDWTPITIPTRPVAPAKSDVVERMDTSITLEMKDGVEYSIDGVNWFSETKGNVTVTDGKITFKGLTQVTEYTIRSRVKATNAYPNPHFHGWETPQTVNTKNSLPDPLKDIFTYDEPGDLTYSKTPKKAEVTKKTEYDYIGEPIVVKYYKDGVEVKNPTDAGEYTVMVSAPATDEYPAVPETFLGTFTISQKEITISGIVAKDKEYDGNTTASLDYSNVKYDGIIPADNGKLELTATGTFVDANAGTDKTVNISYDTNALGGIVSANYKLATSGNQTSITATITPITITADMVTLNAWKFYKVADSPDTIDVAADDNLIVAHNGDILISLTDYDIRDNSETAIGEHTVTITGKGNYQGIVEKGWEIVANPILAGVSASNLVEPYDGTAHTIVVVNSLNGGNITYGKSEKDISLDALTYTDAGTYKIYYKVVPIDDTYAPYESFATLTITPKEVGIEWENTEGGLVYNGKIQAPSANVISGLISEDTCKVITSSNAKNVGIGYIATATELDNPNYKLPSANLTKEFNIIPKPIEVRAKSISKYVNASDPALTYEAEELCTGDTLTGITLTREQGESVGTYQISISVDPTVENQNYSIEAVPGTFTITNRPSHNGNPNGGDSGDPDDSGSSPFAPLPKKDTPKEKKPSDGLPKQIVKDNTKKDGDKKEIDKDLNSSDKLDDGKDNNEKDTLKKYEDVKDEPVVENDKIKYGDGNISIVIDGDNQPGAGGDKPGTPEGALNVNVKSLEELVDTVLTDEEKERVKNGEEVTIRIFGEEKVPSEEAKTAVEECIKNGKIPFDLGDGKSAEVGMHFGKTINIKVMKKLGSGQEVEVTDWNGKMTVTVDIPKDLIADGRNYYVIAYVNGEAKRIAATVNADNTITFEAEEGAEYAICYIDESEIPLFDLGLHKGRHHLLWLYLILLLLFFVTRAITKEKANAVKISLFAGDVVVAGLLLFVVKICLLSVIICLAEIAIALAIHLKMKG